MNKAQKQETFRVSGEGILNKFKNLINEGSVRRITIKDNSGRVLLDIPLAIGLVGTVLAPVLAAVGVIAALVTKCTISVEKGEKK